MALVATGKRYREIAEACFVAEQTVQNMLKDATSRMNCDTVTQAIVKAVAYEMLIVDSEAKVTVPEFYRAGRRISIAA